MKKRIELRSLAQYNFALDFNVIADIVACPYSFNFSQFNKIPVKDIGIHFYELNKRVSSISTHQDIISIGHEFDFDFFWKLDISQRKITLLKLIDYYMRLLNNRLEWDMDEEVFIRAFEECIKIDFNWKSYISKSITSPDKKSQARLYAELNGKNIDYYIHLFHFRKKNPFKIIKVIETWSLSSTIERMNKKIKWMNSEMIMMIPKYGVDCKILIDIDGNVSHTGNLPKYCNTILKNIRK